MEKMDKLFSKIARSQFESLGTFIDVQIIVGRKEDISKAEKDLEKIKKEYSRLEKIFSRFDCDSELSHLNENLNKFLLVSDEMRDVAITALKFHHETEGFFDPRIIGFLECAGYNRDFKSIFCSKLYSEEKEASSFGNDLCQDLEIKNKKVCFKKRMDFSGVAKGYITDLAKKYLKSKGWKIFLVDSGGDMYFSGRDEENNSWTVDIEGAPKNKLLLNLSGKGIATSGISRRKWEKEGKRFHHLINPKNPKTFSFNLKSVTVIASNTTSADVWAKAIFLMGEDNAKKFAQAKKIPCAILDYKGNLWISSSIKKYL